MNANEVDNLIEWMTNCENLPPGTIAYMSAMNSAYAEAATEIILTDDRDFADESIEKVMYHSPYYAFARGLYAILNGRKDKFHCPLCGGDERDGGQHGVLLNPLSWNEPPIYVCELLPDLDSDYDSAKDDIEF